MIINYRNGQLEGLFPQAEILLDGGRLLGARKGWGFNTVLDSMVASPHTYRSVRDSPYRIDR